jgi:uncharacterized protein with ParB-like and HNH nuclease domain
MNPSTIQGIEKSISKIFGDEYVFTIPKYKPPYAWTIEEAGLLFDDLIIAMENGGKAIDNLDPYFLGSVVLIKKVTSYLVKCAVGDNQELGG